uniref:Uncharacterized protein n=1 Tax=Cyprinus carpio carpio TaxID=630221 RepID=A0A9J7XQM6_CYPCA
YSLLLDLMADVCLPLSAGDDTFELHSIPPPHPVCFSAQARCTQDAICSDVFRRDTTDPGCIHSGGCEPGVLSAAFVCADLQIQMRH